ncbi:ABC transporter permease [Micromonospora carbonacea]|uniref:Putative spermidine/putrescine transport system permease protein n=1 Tax=Micromonospora carbonacea TaxID=47853 RepID=A0A1C5AU13_9ACTN|nr:ABC transporter permease [Micromonospora carbonacea]SCF48690.1 putative spermidine/putrescine transport system permease protein [Micromonospora carbonacea]
MNTRVLRAALRHRGTWIILRGVLLVLILAFIAVPMLMVVWTSIQPDTYPAFPPSGLSLRWWSAALTREWLLPMALSAQVALGSAVCALVLGSAAAYTLARGAGRGRRFLEGFLAAPLLLPEIVISLAVVQLVSVLDARRLIGPVLLVATHALIGIPFVLRTVGVSLLGVNPVWERAARDLGASAWRAFYTVTLPLMRSGMFAGALFAFIVSFNNVELSLFLTSRDANTLPIRLLQYMEYQYSPTLACVAVTSVVGICAIAGAASRFVRLTDFIHGEST